MKIFGWVLFSLLLLPLCYWFIQPSLSDADLRAIGRIEYDVIESLSEVNLTSVLNGAMECDSFFPINKDTPLLGSLVPAKEKGFFIRLCQPTSYDFEGQLTQEEKDPLAIVGITPLRDELTNKPTSRNLIRYQATNGTYSAGDLLFCIVRDEEGNVRGPKQSRIYFE